MLAHIDNGFADAGQQLGLFLTVQRILQQMPVQRDFNHHLCGDSAQLLLHGPFQ
ncbi:hypothetical protein D3C80_1971620 [compost metagenome]